VAPNQVSEVIDFASGTIQTVGVLDKYCQKPESLDSVSLLEFATHYDWRGSRYIKQGRNKAKPYMVNIWPCYHPGQEDEALYEKYC
jgi:hypothetical protein